LRATHPRHQVELNAPPRPAHRAANGCAPTILVVEDEDFVREVTCEVLQFEGYQVLEARSAVEALRIFHQGGGSVQLLLTDIVLPGKSGRDLARNLRKRCPHLKTLFVSGYPENDAMEKELPDEKAFYLPKPFSVESLMRMVRHILVRNSESDSGESERKDLERFLGRE
jgi:two-component system cell cycle sensor histidine kinase/response regulator CckA